MWACFCVWLCVCSSLRFRVVVSVFGWVGVCVCGLCVFVLNVCCFLSVCCVFLCVCVLGGCMWCVRNVCEVVCVWMCDFLSVCVCAVVFGVFVFGCEHC